MCVCVCVFVYVSPGFGLIEAVEVLTQSSNGALILVRVLAEDVLEGCGEQEVKGLMNEW